MQNPEISGLGAAGPAAPGHTACRVRIESQNGPGSDPPKVSVDAWKKQPK